MENTIGKRGREPRIRRVVRPAPALQACQQCSHALFSCQESYSQGVTTQQNWFRKLRMNCACLNNLNHIPRTGMVNRSKSRMVFSDAGEAPTRQGRKFWESARTVRETKTACPGGYRLREKRKRDTLGHPGYTFSTLSLVYDTWKSEGHPSIKTECPS